VAIKPGSRCERQPLVAATNQRRSGGHSASVINGPEGCFGVG
jgi:hypothetical protein